MEVIILDYSNLEQEINNLKIKIEIVKSINQKLENEIKQKEKYLEELEKKIQN